MERVKILIDTDIGDDIDDAFAVQYALDRPDTEVVAITTVYKNALQRAQMTKKLLTLNGRTDIPVVVGEDMPFKEPLRPFLFEKKGEDGLYGLLSEKPDLKDYAPDGTNAVDFIIETAEKYPNEIIFCAIGPMTNLAKAILKNRAAIEKYKAIYVMAGNIDQVYEWNIMCDPEAAKIVFESGLPITAVSGNVTLKTAFTHTIRFKVDGITSDTTYTFHYGDALTNIDMTDFVGTAGSHAGRNPDYFTIQGSTTHIIEFGEWNSGYSTYVWTEDLTLVAGWY